MILPSPLPTIGAAAAIRMGGGGGFAQQHAGAGAAFGRGGGGFGRGLGRGRTEAKLFVPAQGLWLSIRVVTWGRNEMHFGKCVSSESWVHANSQMLASLAGSRQRYASMPLCLHIPADRYSGLAYGTRACTRNDEPRKSYTASALAPHAVSPVCQYDALPDGVESHSRVTRARP